MFLNNLHQTANAILLGIKNGFGKNIWDIPFDHITKFYKVCGPSSQQRHQRERVANMIFSRPSTSTPSPPYIKFRYRSPKYRSAFSYCAFINPAHSAALHIHLLVSTQPLVLFGHLLILFGVSQYT